MNYRILWVNWSFSPSSLLNLLILPFLIAIISIFTLSSSALRHTFTRKSRCIIPDPTMFHRMGLSANVVVGRNHHIQGSRRDQSKVGPTQLLGFLQCIISPLLDNLIAFLFCPLIIILLSYHHPLNPPRSSHTSTESLCKTMHITLLSSHHHPVVLSSSSSFYPLIPA